MTNLVTKELLSEVLGEEVLVTDIFLISNEIYYDSKAPLNSLDFDLNISDEYSKRLNLDTLIRLMIEYITDLDYSLDIDCDGQYNIELIGYCEDSDEFGCLKLRTKSFNTLLEPMVEAVTWILENK